MQIFALIYLSFQLFFLLKKKIKRNNGVFLITVLKTSTPICHLKQRQVALLGKGKIACSKRSLRVPCLSFKLPERLSIFCEKGSLDKNSRQPFAFLAFEKSICNNTSDDLLTGYLEKQQKSIRNVNNSRDLKLNFIEHLLACPSKDMNKDKNTEISSNAISNIFNIFCTHAVSHKFPEI